ncbi:hypothetical protein Agub_g1803, partial [Astrephomene gubernaculifera]
RPPHLRRRESQADGGGGGGSSSAYCSDSDMSDTEYTGGSALTLGLATSSSISAGSGAATAPTAASGAAAGAAAAAAAGGGGVVVDRFRSSRVRLAALSCIQAMARSDPRALHAHWSALLPLHSPLQPRPLTPHLLTVLLYDPLAKVRALAASTLACLLDGPAQRAILAVAEARSMTPRTPLRGFLTLSLSLGQLLLGAHAGLLAAAAREGSAGVLPGVLRALVVLLAASPAERLPPELLPETIKVLRLRWAALSAAPSAAATAAAPELAAIHAAYLACIAECFATKQPIAGLAAYLMQPQPQPQPQQQQETQQQPQHNGAGGASRTAPDSNSNSNGCNGSSTAPGDDAGGAGAPDAAAAAGGAPPVAHSLVGELLEVGRDPEAAAVLRIEALAALKGLAAHYTAALPQDVWSDLRATAAVGLSSAPTPRPSPNAARTREGPLSRTSSSSSLSAAAGFAPPSPARTSARSAERSNQGSQSWRQTSNTPQTQPTQVPNGGGGGGGGGSNSSPEDKAAQLSVKLVSDYLAAVARQYGMARTDASGAAAGDSEGASAGGSIGPPPSPGVVSLAAAVVPRQQQAAGVLLQGGGCAASPAEREAGVRQLAVMWRDAVSLLVPAATSHVSYMVRSAGLACLGEVPEPVFSRLDSHLQQRVLALLSEAAAADAVAASRAAACKALGAAAAFPAVLAHAELSGQVTRALSSCLRDSVLSVRIAAGWAVANLCDAHRRRLEEAPAVCRGAANGEQHGSQEEERELLLVRSQSHGHASTSTSSAADWPSAGAGRGDVATGRCQPPQLQQHHYLQLAALCGAAIAATQDADKVRANGVRAVGNL